MAHQIYQSQSRKSPLLDSLESKLKETEDGLNNICSAIEQGLVSNTLTNRLNILERQKEEILSSISKERVDNPHVDEVVIWYAISKYKVFDSGKVHMVEYLLENFIKRIEYDEESKSLAIYYQWKNHGKSQDIDDSELQRVRLAQLSLHHIT